MAEESDLERTEQPSPRRLEQAREDGQVPHSRELSTFMVLATGVAVLWVLGGWAVHRSARLFARGLEIDRADIQDPAAMGRILWMAAADGLTLLAPLFVALIVAAVVTPALLGGWNFSTKGFTPDWSRLNPLQGVGRLFSLSSLVELSKAILKAVLIGSVAWWVIQRDPQSIFALIAQPQASALGQAGREVLFAAAVVVAGLGLIALIDVPWQLWHYRSKLKMTREEVRKEAKEQEGDPHVKGRIRQQQREMARRRMMSEVPKANVVVTNPTHYAVALRYQAEQGGAPRVVAKGRDQLAARIREIAAQSGVPVVEAPALTRALFRHCDLEQQIPGALYTAVAEVMAYVYHLKRYLDEGGMPPAQPTALPVPPELDVRA
ncbi:MAG: flagellar type III secretion system protein FlhB [Rhodocyclaceae bacterium]|nr:flagellar type III secretion system protein FlhB [Rhodocyclaceae bacterium]